MSFEFVIPVSREDLLNKTGVNHFVVDEVLSLRELPSALQDVNGSFRAKGGTCILEHFDTFFSILSLQKEIDQDLKEDAWTCIVKISNALANHLAGVLEEMDMSPDTRVQNLNMVKMTAYLLCQFIELFEADDTKPSTTQLVTAKGRGRASQKKKDSAMGIDWDREREQGMKALLHLVQLNLHRLWDPPIPEEEFVNLITNCGYKMLENPAVTRVTSKDTRDTISHLLGVMVKRYNHGLGASLKIIQLLQHFEHLIGPLAQTVAILTNDYGIKNVVCEVMREIGRIDAKDMARDTSGTRNFATFLVELAEKIPAAMLTNISVLLCHLDGESYAMRNGVLGVMAEILMRVLSKDDLDSHQKAARDQFLDRLEDHIHDVHAFVRGRVMQLWLNIVNEKCLPLPRQENVVNLVIGRLQDKSSQVRRHAMQLITALLKSNPFAAKLPADELRVNYEQEKLKLQQMMPDEPEPSPNDGIYEKLNEEWKAIEERLKLFLEEMQEDSENRDPETLNIGDDDTPESILKRIFDHLVESEYREAVALTSNALEVWPDLPVFQETHTQTAADTQTDTDSQTDLDTQTDPDTQTEYSEEDPTGNLEMPIKKNIRHLREIFVEHKRLSLVSATEAVENLPASQDDNVVNEVSKQQVLVQYLKDSLSFAVQVQTAVPIICQLLGSKNTTDVLEAIEFFVTGFEFGVSASMQGIRRMLPLIWSREAGIKEAVVGAYKRLYLNPQSGNQRAKALAVVKNLSALTYGCTLGDLTSLEGLIVELMKSSEINSSVIQMLWERFTMKVPNTSEAESRAAITLLAMAAGAESNIAKSNIDVLVNEGLGTRAETDFLLARQVCLALMKLGVNKKMKGEVAAEPFRLPESHDMFTRLAHILVTGIKQVENRYWIPLAEQAVNVIYRLAEHPDTICSDIIKKLANTVPTANQDEGSEDNGTPQSCASAILARLLSVGGHVALRQLIHLDVGVFGELKRRHAVQEEKESKTKSKHRKSASDTISKTKDSTTAEGIDEEMGLGGAAAEDAESEYIRKICEHEIVTGQGLLASLRPLLVAVCTNQVKYPDPELRTAATLALAKFMMVSSEFCDSHLQLLFTILEKSPSATIRANTIIALGDLTFRFPNLIEPWTPHLYARLRDESPQVRKNTMQVLTHLILNDMVKVKGQISEMATCIVDDDERISGLAKLFFNELARKGNAVYNIMPDVISRLSDPDVGVDEENFRSIMKYLFSFIQKDRQCESLVEKLCHRYRATRVDRQWRDLSYCLSMLSYSEKSLRKLQENFTCFADKLAEDEVYNCFCTIISKSRSFVKPEAKVLIDELEQRLEQCHKKGLEEGDIALKASHASNIAANQKGKHKTPRKPGKTPARKGRNTKAAKKFDSDSDSENGGDENETPAPRKQSQRVTKSKPKPSFSSDEESDIELFELDKTGGKEDDADDGVEDKSEDSDSDPMPLRKVKNSKKRPASGRKRALQSISSPS